MRIFFKIYHQIVKMFKLSKNTQSGVRIGTLTTAHGEINTPFFMPVGTQGSVKGVSPSELNDMGAEIMLANTYHLFLRPGEKLIKKLGGLHEFINWPKPILTDSGGYQVFSLSNKEKTNLKSTMSTGRQEISNLKVKEINPNNNLVKVKNNGVEFKSYLDGSKHLFTPERVIQIQLDLGVDIIMPLDYCPSGKATKAEIERACKLTVEWAKRSKEYFDSKKQTDNNLAIKQFNNSTNRPLLFGIIQGGLDENLRRQCAEEIIKLNFDGYAVGGLAVDYETRDMWNAVKLMGEVLPVDNPRYLMGVGTPNDIIKATRLGMDMFDCVLPTRLGRHGSVYRRKNNKLKIKNQKLGESSALGYFELINMLNSKYKDDGGVIDKNCGCYACRGGFSQAYISHLVRAGEILGIRLTTLHNLWQYLNLMRNLRGLT